MSDPTSRLFAFETALGWIGILHRNEIVQQLKFGFSSPDELYTCFSEDHFKVLSPSPFEVRLQRELQQYASGTEVDFEHVDLFVETMTDFQESVTRACRLIAYGTTLSYGQVATMAGSPGAARAVGSVMSKNPFPLLVPCHRVTGSTKLGGFSAAEGTAMKRRLLELEGALMF